LYRDYNLALEQAWGLEAPPLNPDIWVRIPRPHGFIVAERRLRVAGRGPWAVYWARKEGITSLALARRLAEHTSAKSYRLLGLKDADAIAYQYVYLLEPRKPHTILEGEGFRAWLVGWEPGPRRLGAHLWNMFRLTLEPLMGTPGGVCDALSHAETVPGYYGPQRFGVYRPNTHLQGLYKGLGAFGLLAREYRYEYGLGGGPGGYEARALAEAARRGPWRVLRHGPGTLAAEALQSYIWNRALSIALAGDPEAYGSPARTPCPRPGRAVVAPLPSRRLLSSTGRWAGLVSWVLEEEGVPAWLLPSRAPKRALVAEPCWLSCRAVDGRVVVWLGLPRGLYATVAVRAAVHVAWRGLVGEEVAAEPG